MTISSCFCICSSKTFWSLNYTPATILCCETLSFLGSWLEYTDTCEDVCCNRRKVQLFEMHFFTLFITVLVCYFPYETSMVEDESLPVHVPVSLRYFSVVPLFPKTYGRPSLFRDEIIHCQHFALFILKLAEIRTYAYSNVAISCV